MLYINICFILESQGVVCIFLFFFTNTQVQGVYYAPPNQGEDAMCLDFYGCHWVNKGYTNKNHNTSQNMYIIVCIVCV